MKRISKPYIALSYEVHNLVMSYIAPNNFRPVKYSRSSHCISLSISVNHAKIQCIEVLKASFP